MTKLALQFVQAWVDRRSGGVCVRHYFRRPGYPRIALPGIPGSAEFNRAYEAALGGTPIAPMPIGAGRNKLGSVSLVIAQYYDSQQHFICLAEGTKSHRRAILERFREDYGDLLMAKLTREPLVTLLDSKPPHAARNWLKAIRSLCQFAVHRGLLQTDPTTGIKLRSVKSDGIHTWTEDEIGQFEAHHLVGSKPRLAFALLLYTAQRRSDVVRMGRQHIKDGIIAVRQEKTGAALAIPIHSTLAAVLADTPGEHLTLLTTKGGKPYEPNDFSEQFRKWCNEAGLPTHCSAHGLRKAACRRLAEAGCSANEIAAISGHATLREVERYTKAVDQVRMARNAMARAG